MRTRCRRMVLLTVLVAAAAAGGCQNPRPNPELQRALYCEECVAGEFDSVRLRGDLYVPALALALTGPTNASVAAMRRVAIAEWERYSGGHALPLPTDSAVVIDRVVDQYVSAYQRRAAVLLRAVGTPMARRVLVAALGALPPTHPQPLRPAARSLAVSLLATWP